MARGHSGGWSLPLWRRSGAQGIVDGWYADTDEYSAEDKRKDFPRPAQLSGSAASPRSTQKDA
jgi:hypothetical protein